MFGVRRVIGDSMTFWCRVGLANTGREEYSNNNGIMIMNGGGGQGLGPVGGVGSGFRMEDCGCTPPNVVSKHIPEDYEAAVDQTITKKYLRSCGNHLETMFESGWWCYLSLRFVLWSSTRGQTAVEAVS